MCKRTETATRPGLLDRGATSAKSHVIRLTGMALLALWSLVIAMEGVAFAKETGKAPLLKRAAKTPRFISSPWESRCVSTAKGLSCFLMRRIVLAGTNRNLLQLRMTGKGQAMTLHLPHGLDLRRSLEVQVDGRKLGTAQYVTSLRDGLIATLKLNKSALASMGKGKMLNIRLPVRGGSQLNVRMDLKGFREAFDKVRKK